MLFDVTGSPTAISSRLQGKTTDMVSTMRDKKEIRRLDTLLRRLRSATTSLDQARVAAEISDVADALVANSIREANRAGQTWRQIGANLGIPFQTLYRRYGAEAGQRET